jgi:hypothetical protein
MKNYHYFTVPIGIMLSVLGVMELLISLNDGNTIKSLFSMVGIITILIINIKTRLFTNFKFKKLW